MALIKCPECGKAVSDRSKICVGCGYPIEEYVCELENEKNEEEIRKEAEKKELEGYLCKSCGKQNAVGEDYCVYCGNRLTPYKRIVFGCK